MDTGDLALGLVGVGLLLVGAGAVATGAPTQTTEVAASAPDAEALADKLPRYSTGEIDPVPASSLSPAEQTALREAQLSPDGITTGPPGVDAGPVFDYRNDVVTHRVVGDDEGLHLVRVVTTVGYVRLALGVVAVALGGLVVVLAAWRARSR